MRPRRRVVEAGAREVSEDVMLEAIMFGHEKIKEICAEQDKFLTQFEVVKYEFEKQETDAEVNSTPKSINFYAESFKDREKIVNTIGKFNKELEKSCAPGPGVRAGHRPHGGHRGALR